jgi:protein subunit release factor A
MAGNIIIEKLEGVKQRFVEVSEMLTRQEVLSDMEKYIGLNKE